MYLVMVTSGCFVDSRVWLKQVLEVKNILEKGNPGGIPRFPFLDLPQLGLSFNFANRKLHMPGADPASGISHNELHCMLCIVIGPYRLMQGTLRAEQFGRDCFVCDAQAE